MPTAPTFVATYASSSWSVTTSPKTVSVTVAAGDYLVIFAGSAPLGCVFNTPTGGGLTYTLLLSIVPARNSGTIYCWGAPCPTSQTFTLSLTSDAATKWGFLAYRYSGTPGVDNGAGQGVGYNMVGSPSSTPPYVDLSQTVDLGAICWLSVDGAAVSGTSRSWGTVDGNAATETKYERQTGAWTIYGARWSTSGLYGKQPTLTLPISQTWLAMAVLLAGTGSTVTGEMSWSGISYQTLVGGKLWQGEAAWSSQSNMTLVGGNVNFGVFDFSAQSDMTLTASSDAQSYTISEVFGPNDSDDVYETWLGIELRYVAGYDANPGAFRMRGGFFSVAGGDPALAPQFLNAGLKYGDFALGDPGYHVMVRQQPHCPGFAVTVTLEYLGP